MTLAELPIGKSAVITKVGGEGELRLRLLDMGLIPKTHVHLQKAAPMGDPIEIRLRGYELTLRLEDASKIDIVEVNDHDLCTGGEPELREDNSVQRSDRRKPARRKLSGRHGRPKIR